MIRHFLKTLKSKFIVEKIIPVNIATVDGQYLEGQTVFISGGAGGIGKAISECFIANGARVIIAGRNPEKLKSVCSELGNNAKYVVFDINDTEQYDTVLNVLLYESSERINILVNCAGVHGPSDFWKVTPNDWDIVMNTNLKSMYFLSQAFGEYFRKNSIKGHILNISSASALKHGKTPYEISKNGVRTITLGIAEELIKYGIVVNCLAPGPTATEMLNLNKDSSLKWSGNPAGRVATPEEIANWAVFLTSDLGNYVVGDSLYVTGGSGTICIDK